MIVDRLAVALLTAMAYFTMPSQRLLAGCKADLECFRVAKEALLRQLEKAALDAGMEVELNGKSVQANIEVASFGAEERDWGPIVACTGKADALSVRDSRYSFLSKVALTGCGCCCVAQKELSALLELAVEKQTAEGGLPSAPHRGNVRMLCDHGTVEE